MGSSGNPCYRKPIGLAPAEATAAGSRSASLATAWQIGHGPAGCRCEWRHYVAALNRPDKAPRVRFAARRTASQSAQSLAACCGAIHRLRLEACGENSCGAASIANVFASSPSRVSPCRKRKMSIFPRFVCVLDCEPEAGLRSAPSAGRHVAAVCLTARSQPAISSSARSRGSVGWKRRSTCHCAASSSRLCQTPTASPAR